MPTLEESVRTLALLIEERVASDAEIATLVADISTRLRVLSSALSGTTTVVDDSPEAIEVEEPEDEEDEDEEDEAPTGGNGTVPPEILPVAKQAGLQYGVDPAVLLAIEIWETGWFTSDAWRFRRNPGGMKTAPSQFQGVIVTDRDYDHPTYLRFKTWQDGIKGHALFLGKGARYAKIHETTDPREQLDAISLAGYAEGSNSWLLGVKGALTKAQQLLEAVETKADSSLGSKIVAAMRALPDPFPYEPETNGGQLGCANVVSRGLKDAGVLQKLELSVDGLVGALKARGWAAIQKPYGDGDVIVWSATASSNGHKHVGVLDADGAKVWALDNSSSQRKVICEDLSKNTRPVEQVLRAPGGK